MNQTDLDARKNKYFYMYEGLKFINTELQDEWIEYVDSHINDQIDAHIIELSIMLFKNLKYGISYASITKMLLELETSHEMINQIVALIIKFSSKGKEFKEYWCTQYPESKIIKISNSCKRI